MNLFYMTGYVEAGILTSAAFFMPSFGIESGVVSIPAASQQKKPHSHPACHSGVECSRTIFWFSGVSLRGMPAQKTPSFASPAHARFAKVFSFAGCSRLLVLSYTVRDAKGVIRWRALIFPPGHPALALALFYQIWPCPCKCPNGHKNGICVCFYPKSAISCRDCPMYPPKVCAPHQQKVTNLCLLTRAKQTRVG